MALPAFARAGCRLDSRRRLESGDSRLNAIGRRPYRSIFQQQDAIIQNSGRDKGEANIWQPLKDRLKTCLRDNQGADDEFEAVHQASREQLLESVWGFRSPGETRTVEVHVAQLRKKLGRPDLIRTVRGLGYKAIA